MLREHIWLKFTLPLKTLKSMNFQVLYFIQSSFLIKDDLPRCTVNRWQKKKKKGLYSVLRLSHKTTSQSVILPRSDSLMVKVHRTLFPFQWSNTFLVPPENLSSVLWPPKQVVGAVLGGQDTRQSKAADTSKQRLNWHCYFGRVVSRVNLLHLTRHHWVRVRMHCCWTDWKQQLGETLL